MENTKLIYTPVHYDFRAFFSRPGFLEPKLFGYFLDFHVDENVDHINWKLSRGSVYKDLFNHLREGMAFNLLVFRNRDIIETEFKDYILSTVTIEEVDIRGNNKRTMAVPSCRGICKKLEVSTTSR